MKKLILLFISMSLLSCSTLKVSSDAKVDVDFSKYSTFKVVYFTHEDDIKDNLVNINNFNRARIEKAINEGLQLKSLTPSETPDLIFLYAADVDIQKGYESYTDYNGGPYMGYSGARYGRYYRGSYNYGYSSATTTTRETQTVIGRLRIACIDTQTKELIWMGRASEEIKSDTNLGEEEINKVVSLMIKYYPLTVK